MIRAAILCNQNGRYIGFDCEGHAGYARKGEDVVCAGVSALVINAVNSIGRYTEEEFSTDEQEAKGRISVRLKRPAGHDAELLLKSLALGLQGIKDQYGDEYITLSFKEV